MTSEIGLGSGKISHMLKGTYFSALEWILQSTLAGTKAIKLTEATFLEKMRDPFLQRKKKHPPLYPKSYFYMCKM